jgi:hypothetical protein
MGTNPGLLVLVPGIEAVHRKSGAIADGILEEFRGDLDPILRVGGPGVARYGKRPVIFIIGKKLTNIEREGGFLVLIQVETLDEPRQFIREMEGFEQIPDRSAHG